MSDIWVLRIFPTDYFNNFVMVFKTEELARAAALDWCKFEMDCEPEADRLPAAIASPEDEDTANAALNARMEWTDYGERYFAIEQHTVHDRNRRWFQDQTCAPADSTGQHTGG